MGVDSSATPSTSKARQHRAAYSADDDDDFAEEALRDCDAYRSEVVETGTRKRKRRQRPTDIEMSRNQGMLCELLDPEGSVLSPAEVARIMQHSRDHEKKAAKPRDASPHHSSEGEAELRMPAPSLGASSGRSSAPNLVDVVVPASQWPATFATPASPQRNIKKNSNTSASTSSAARRPIVTSSEDESEEELLIPRKPGTSSKRRSPDRKQAVSEDEEEVITSSLSQRSTNRSASNTQATQSMPSANTEDGDEEVEMIFGVKPPKGKAPKSRNVSSTASGTHTPTSSPSSREWLREIECRPAFSHTPEQAQIGPLVLDAEAGIQVPASINRFLRDYQRQGIRFMYRAYKEGRGCILGDDMGLGKTVQVIGFLAAIMRKSGGSKDENRRIEASRIGRVDCSAAPNATWPTCLILCPQTVVTNWRNELNTWGYFEHAVYGTGYPSPLQNFRRGRLDIVLASHEYAHLHISEIESLDWSCIFADEAHKFKNPRSGITMAMNRFTCQVRVAMSGTIIQNRYEEMWPILDWTNPKRFGDVDTWKKLIAIPLKLGQRKKATPQERQDGRLISEHLTRNLLPPYMLRRTKALIAEQLPKKQDKVVFCPLAPEQLRAYRLLAQQPEVLTCVQADDPCKCGRLDDEGRPYRTRNCCSTTVQGEILRTMYLMSCLANHAALFFPDPDDLKDDREEVRERFRRQQMYTRRLWPNEWETLRNNPQNGFRTDLCGKWLVLRDLMRTWHQNGDKLLLFSRNLRLLDWLEYWVEHAGYNHLRLDGKTPQAHRQDKVDRFNRDKGIFVFLISTTAGGTGLNLTGANKVVIFDPNWNPAHDMQAMDRAYRFGQTRDVHVFRLVGAGTLEELIYGRQIYKSQVANIGYTASRERRFFEGVEGSKEHQGELFGVKNMFTLHEERLVTKSIIEDCEMTEKVHEVEAFAREFHPRNSSSAGGGGGGVGGDYELGVAASPDEGGDSSTRTRRGRPHPAKRERESTHSTAPTPTPTLEDAILAQHNIPYTHEHGEVLQYPRGGGGTPSSSPPEQAQGDGRRPPRGARSSDAGAAASSPKRAAAVWPPPRSRRGAGAGGPPASSAPAAPQSRSSAGATASPGS